MLCDILGKHPDRMLATGFAMRRPEARARVVVDMMEGKVREEGTAKSKAAPGGLRESRRM